MFRHSTVMHGGWAANTGPAKDLITMEHNPQFKLEIKDAAGGGAVWLLLSRHITDISDFKEQFCHAITIKQFQISLYLTGGLFNI